MSSAFSCSFAMSGAIALVDASGVWLVRSIRRCDAFCVGAWRSGGSCVSQGTFGRSTGRAFGLAGRVASGG